MTIERLVVLERRKGPFVLGEFELGFAALDKHDLAIDRADDDFSMIVFSKRRGVREAGREENAKVEIKRSGNSFVSTMALSKKVQRSLDPNNKVCLLKTFRDIYNFN